MSDRPAPRIMIFVCALVLWIITLACVFVGWILGAVVTALHALACSWAWATYHQYERPS